MTYSHYWRMKPEHPDWRPGFAQLSADTARIVDAVRGAGVELAGYDHTTGRYTPDAPTVSEGGVHLQGWHSDPRRRPEFTGMSFGVQVDPLAWYREEPVGSYGRRMLAAYEHDGYLWEFCATARKPYDLAVATVLLRAAVLMPACFTVASDGTWWSEWVSGVDLTGVTPDPRGLYRDLFGRCAPNVLGAHFPKERCR